MSTEERAKLKLECLKIAQAQLQIEPITEYATTDSLLKKAEELYQFVVKKD